MVGWGRFGIRSRGALFFDLGFPMNDLRAPFTYFGGKSRIADKVWERFGNVRNFVEPFFGSGAVLLRRPTPFEGPETVNDLDGLLCNFWRAVRSDPDAVAEHADWPVIENDLHARHAWLVGVKDSLQARLEGDPEYFDAKVAGWWCWGACCWIGSSWCSGVGPWSVTVGADGSRTLDRNGDHGVGVSRKIVRLGDSGVGINRQIVRLGNSGVGVNRVTLASINILDMMRGLSDRLRRVRVCCGDWSRVCGPSVTIHHGLTAVFLDPPYSAEAGRCEEIYRVESLAVAHDVREWAISHGVDPLMRIALCGYEGEHDMPGDWECLSWKTQGGYGSQGSTASENSRRERVWFSPHCINPDIDLPLFRRDGELFV